MFTSMRSVWTSKSIPEKGPCAPNPALFARMETGVSRNQSKILSGADAEARSQGSTRAWMVFVARRSAANSLSRASFRATSARLKPRAAKSFANSRPMPEDAPVIRAQSAISVPECIPRIGGSAIPAAPGAKRISGVDTDLESEASSGTGPTPESAQYCAWQAKSGRPRCGRGGGARGGYVFLLAFTSVRAYLYPSRDWDGLIDAT